jgi:nicotinamidase-related amidase
MTTSGCVRATVVDAFSYNFIVIIPEECVGDRGIISHKVSLFDMHMKYADVLPLSEVVQYIDSLKS